MPTAIKMSLRLAATLALLLGLIMWLFTGPLPPLIYTHIAFAILVLLLAIAVLFLPATVSGNNTTIRTLQGIAVLLAICTMLVGYLQYQGTFSGLAATLTHLILALALVSLIETTLARQSRLARQARVEM